MRRKTNRILLKGFIVESGFPEHQLEWSFVFLSFCSTPHFGLVYFKLKNVGWDLPFWTWLTLSNVSLSNELDFTPPRESLLKVVSLGVPLNQNQLWRFYQTWVLKEIYPHAAKLNFLKSNTVLLVNLQYFQNFN
jgi:hypothetical protein